MRMTDYLILVLIVSGTFFAFGYLGDRFDDAYGGTYGTHTIGQNISTKYYSNSTYIKTKTDTIMDKFSKMSDDDASWFSRIGNGIMAIPVAVILFPAIIIEGISDFVSILTVEGTNLLIPGTLLALIGIYFGIKIIGALIDMFQRSNRT